MIAGTLIVLSLATLSLSLALITRPTGGVELALTTSLVAYAWLLVAALGLSAVGAFAAWPLVGVTAPAAALACGIATRRRAGPAAIDLRRRLGSLRVRGSVTRISVLATVVALGSAYALALALLTPAAEVDAIAYHLTRAAFWVQDGAIGPVDGTQDARIDESPPGAEIAVAVTMLISGGVRLVGLVQWLAVAVSVVAVAGVARRTGAACAPAWFAALLIAPLPVVALQSPTALNDVVVAALVATAVYFLLDERRLSHVLAGLAVACVLLTKLTALAALPFLFGVAGLARPRQGRWSRIVAVAAGAGGGAIWLAVVRSDAGTGAVGGVDTGLLGSADPVRILGRWSKLVTDMLELPGAVGADALIFLVPAVSLGVVGLVAGARRTGDGRELLLAAGLIALTPALVPIADAAARAHRKVWFELGRPDNAFLGLQRDSDVVYATTAWYGAVGLMIAGLGVAVACKGAAWRREPVLALLGVAPLAWIAVVGVAIRYNLYEGRFVMPGFLLGAAVAAPLLYRPAIAWWAVGISASTLALVWVHSGERPAGLPLIERPVAKSVWTRDDAVALPQRGLPEAIRFVDARVPAGARLGLWPAPFPDPPPPEPVALLAFPFFGPQLERTLVYVRSLDEATSRDVEWAMLPRSLVVGCKPRWRRETAPDAAYQAFRFDARFTCQRP